ncbi:MAG TPA: peptide-methionine (S)-S-oxide reductase MsrA [Chitinophagaceae bacterium]|nr:peptide-methionine (S)-S-oxide reductase MsrA [Chitinophagaceae bacterium]
MKFSIIIVIFLLNASTGCTQNKKIKTEPRISTKELSQFSQATFAAGCFWHEEAMFESIKGVKEAISGYAGGITKKPSYESIETGQTGHAETVYVYYDSTQIDYPTLLKIYFAGQDPTQVNGQGVDRGTQYRSVVFYRNNTEKQLIDEYIKAIQSKYKKPIAAHVMPFTKFWTAEGYHQDYIEKNPSQRYVQTVSIPEIRHLQKQFPELVKPGYTY